MNFLLLLLLIIAIILEGVKVSLPLVLICLLGITLYRRDTLVFVLAFFAGLFLDSFLLRPIGSTSVFLLVFGLLILLYQRKYEINSYQFVFFASLLGTGIYLMVFGYTEMWLQAGLTALLACLLLGVMRITKHSKLFEGRETSLHYQ